MNRDKALQLVNNRKFLKEVLTFNFDMQETKRVVHKFPNEFSYLFDSGFVATPCMLRRLEKNRKSKYISKTVFHCFDSATDRLLMLSDLSLKRLVCYLGVSVIGRNAVKGADYGRYYALSSSLGHSLFVYLMNYARYCSYGEAFGIDSKIVFTEISEFNRTVIEYGIKSLLNYSDFSSPKIKNALSSRLEKLFPDVVKNIHEIISDDFKCTDPKKIAKLIERILIQECNEKWIACLA